MKPFLNFCASDFYNKYLLHYCYPFTISITTVCVCVCAREYQTSSAFYFGSASSVRWRFFASLQLYLHFISWRHLSICTMWIYRILIILKSHVVLLMGWGWVVKNAKKTSHNLWTFSGVWLKGKKRRGRWCGCSSPTFQIYDMTNTSGNVQSNSCQHQIGDNKFKRINSRVHYPLGRDSLIIS